MSGGITQPSIARPVGLDGNVAYLPEERRRRSGEPPSGGSGNPPDDMERRLIALEEGHKLIVGKLDSIADGIRDFRLDNEKRFGAIESRLTGLETMLTSKAATSDLTPIETKLATLDGKVSNLPGAPAMITLVLGAVALSLGGAAGLAFTLFRLFKP